MSGVRYPFGTDARLIIDEDGQPDVDTTFAVETNPLRILLDDLFKIVTTMAGTLWWAPTATEDVTQALLDAMSPERLAAFRARIQNAVSQDIRYTDVICSVSQIGSAMSVRITAVANNRNLVLEIVTNQDGTLAVQEASADGAVF